MYVHLKYKEIWKCSLAMKENKELQSIGVQIHKKNGRLWIAKYSHLRLWYKKIDKLFYY